MPPLNPPIEPTPSFPILYQDEHLIAINKPADILVHRSKLDNHETRFVLQELRNQINQHVYPIHRLDKPTSGILLFALNPEIAAALSLQFEERAVEKRYWLLVRGYTEDSGSIDHPLVPKDDFKSRNKRLGKEVKVKPAKEAITEYKTLWKVEIPFPVDKYPCSRYSLVEAAPKTGRKHQLRRHFKHISHPIIGDPKYGKSTHNRYFSDRLDCNRLLLHSQYLSFIHPVSNEKIEIEQKPTGRFLSVLNQLSEHVI